ncbi:MAK10-like protein [Tanacetum coccineum]
MAEWRKWFESASDPRFEEFTKQSRMQEKVLVREEARLITKNVNAISLVKMKKENNTGNNKEKITGEKIVELVEMPRLQPIGYYLNHEINKELIESLIGNQRYNDSLLVTRLVEQGSDVNVMPLSTYNRLRNEKPTVTDIKLSLTSYSYIYPIRIDEDMLVEIAGYVYPVDFVIFEIKEDKKKPFILGTPFLTTTKAEIRFDKGTISLKSGKNKINFFKIPESPRRVEEETEHRHKVLDVPH